MIGRERLVRGPPNIDTVNVGHVSSVWHFSIQKSFEPMNAGSRESCIVSMHRSRTNVHNVRLAEHWCVIKSDWMRIKLAFGWKHPDQRPGSVLIMMERIGRGFFLCNKNSLFSGEFMEYICIMNGCNYHRGLDACFIRHRAYILLHAYSEF